MHREDRREQRHVPAVRRMGDEPAKTCACCGAAARYRCPGCEKRTCSLACINRHKQEWGCTGKRASATFCAIGEFDDQIVQRDYRFLEGLERVVDGAKRRLRDTEPVAAPRRPGFLSPARHHLLKAARERGVHLELLPPGMQRQRENTSRYEGRRRQILWRLEIHFVDAGVHHVVPTVPEGFKVLDLLLLLLGMAGHSSSSGGSTPIVAKQPTPVKPTDISRVVNDPPSASQDPPSIDATATDGASASTERPEAVVASAAASTATSPAELKSASAAGAKGAKAPATGSSLVLAHLDEGERVMLRHHLREYVRAVHAKTYDPPFVAYLPAEHRPQADPRYFEVEMDGTLAAALSGRVVIEHPIIYVALRGGCHAPDFALAD